MEMTRTNIEIDDDLVDRAMRRYGLRSKREAVDLALRRLAGEPMSRKEILAQEGTGWPGISRRCARATRSPEIQLREEIPEQ